VVDADENTNASVVETVSVTVSDSETGDSETVTLYETGANTGIFRNGGMGLASTQALVGSPGNILLETQPGNTITASYTDDDDGTDTSSDTALMKESSLPPDLEVTSITVQDPNPEACVPVTVTVTVKNQNEGSVTSTLFDVDFYVYDSLDSQPVPKRPGDAKQWYTENVPGGTEIQLDFVVTLPYTGTVYLYAQADTTGRVTEGDETNNIYNLESPYVTVDVAASGQTCGEPEPPPGSKVCATAFQDNFGGDLSQWNGSDPSYVYIESGRLRLRTKHGPTSEEYARTTGSIDLSGYSEATLNYSWWTNALDAGEWGQVRVSDDGGTTWTTVGTYEGTNNGTASITLPGTYGVSLTPNFVIEFRVQADKWQDGNYEYFEVDNVVLATCNVVPIPPQEPNTGNIVGTTRYYDENFGQYFYVSGVDVWATCTSCPPPQDPVYTYSLDDYTYGFWNLPVGTYDIYAESIITNKLCNDTITGVQVTSGATTTQHILLEVVY